MLTERYQFTIGRMLLWTAMIAVWVFIISRIAALPDARHEEPNEGFPLAFVLLLGIMGTTAYVLRRWRYGPAIAAFSVSLLSLVVVVAFR
jgi:hypothetical protein